METRQLLYNEQTLPLHSRSTAREPLAAGQPWSSSGKMRSTQTAIPTQKSCFSSEINRQLGSYFMKGDGKAPIQGVDKCCIQKQGCVQHVQKVSVALREVFLGSALLNPSE